VQVAKLPGSDMKFFTRILHRTTPDALMDVMPTVRGEGGTGVVGCCAGGDGGVLCWGWQGGPVLGVAGVDVLWRGLVLGCAALLIHKWTLRWGWEGVLCSSEWTPWSPPATIGTPSAYPARACPTQERPLP